ncbi:BLUF domain-containing protein [Aureimonas populi]|uniref:BLUF domain-containing protein n=2 Tax=Aureimonas populi TaxID=1701758 RepID=A0ABW5CRB1_9HYPH
MIRLVYSSNLSAHTTAADIDEIVERSAMRNADLSITGMLAMEGGRICQILEGPEDAILYLFARIETDERHHGVVEIGRQPIERRAFERWGMIRRPMMDVVMIAFANEH